MKIAVISPDYPSQNRSSYAFVHSRVKLYKQHGHDVKVFILGQINEEQLFEGINIKRSSKNNFIKDINTYHPDVLAIHYPIYKNIPFLQKLNFAKCCWIHGHEILFSFNLRKSKNILEFIKKRIVVIPRTIYQILKVRKFLDHVEFCVFVSKWMREKAEQSTYKKFSNAVIIPNPVDTNLFTYRTPENIKRSISVRSFANNKYGLDIAIKAFSRVKNIKLYIFGSGRLYSKFEHLIQKTKSNTEIKDVVLSHKELSKLYHNYGFFVAPSRVEAQGVAMCEAMACGLPVVAANVGGIPEFVRDGIDGYLVSPNSPKAIKDAASKLVSDKSKFMEMSRNARANIEAICSDKIITKKEIYILQQAIQKFNEA